MRFELMTSSLPRRRSTPELRGPESQSVMKTGAGDEIRTRDPQLGRLMLYQLSYTRPKISNCEMRISNLKTPAGINSQFEIRNSQFHLVQGVGFEPT